jgi:Flp pilus assembly protein TadG
MRRILKRHRILRFGRRQEGAAAVEFALCLIPLLLIVGGIIDFGQAWYMQSALSAASREGARYATRYTTNPTNPSQRLAPANLSPSVAKFVEDKYTSLMPGLDATLGGATASIKAGDQVSVTVTAPKDWLFLSQVIPGLPAQLSSTTWMSLE